MSVTKYFVKDMSRRLEIDEHLALELNRAGYSKVEMTKRTEHQRPYKGPRREIWNRESTAVRRGNRHSRTRPESRCRPGCPGTTTRCTLPTIRILGITTSNGIRSLRS